MGSEWREGRLGDFIELHRGYDLPQQNRRPGPVPLVSSSGISDHLAAAMIDGPGVVTGRYGTIGQVFYLHEPFWPLNTTLYVSDFKGNDPRFASYLLRTVDFLAFSDKAAVPGVNRNHVHEAIIRWPVSLDEQKRIAGILGALDDKIELNRGLSQTLESMARALFKSWFVDFDPVRTKAKGGVPVLPEGVAHLFPDSLEDSNLGPIPRGWRLGVLEDLTEVLLGGDWGSDQPGEDSTVPAFCIRGADIPDLQRGGRGAMPVRYLKPASLSKRRLGDGDLVIEVSGGSPTQSTGRAVLVSNRLLGRLDHPLACSNFCRLMKPRSRISSEFIYLWMRLLYDNDELLQYESGTTGIKNFAISLFSERHQLAIAPSDLLEVFSSLAASLFADRDNLGGEIDVLMELRDSLVPWLISGSSVRRHL